MPHFVMIARDGPKGAELRKQFRTQHVEHVMALSQQGRIVAAGPMKDESGQQSCGAVIIFEAANLDEAKRTVAADPYVHEGVFAETTVDPFKLVLPATS